MPISYRTSRLPSITSVANSNEAITPDTSIGNYAYISPARSDYEESNPFLDNLATQNQVEARLHETTFERRLLASMVPNSSSVQYHFEEVLVKIGMRSAITLNEEGWTIYRQTCTAVFTATSRESLSIIWNRLESNERLRCTGAALGQASLDAHGMRPISTLTLRILGLNSGMDTEIINTLLWTSSEEELISLISYDSSTDTQSLLKLKVRVSSYPQHISGSLQTSTQDNGTLI